MSSMVGRHSCRNGFGRVLSLNIQDVGDFRENVCNGFVFHVRPLQGAMMMRDYTPASSPGERAVKGMEGRRCGGPRDGLEILRSGPISPTGKDLIGKSLAGGFAIGKQ